MNSIFTSRWVQASAAAAIAVLGLVATTSGAEAAYCAAWRNGYCLDWRNSYYSAPRYYYAPPAYGYSYAPRYGYYPPSYGYYAPEPSFGLVIR